jgi:hypothetical protein
MADDDRGAEVLGQQRDPPPAVGLHSRPDEHSPIMPDRTWRTGVLADQATQRPTQAGRDPSGRIQG